jgi:hypothetical protein
MRSRLAKASCPGLQAPDVTCLDADPDRTRCGPQPESSPKPGAVNHGLGWKRSYTLRSRASSTWV